MQKYLAILKDSLREAIDGWIFTVMLVASTLLIVVIGSISYEPLDADTALTEIVKNFNQVYADRGQSIFPRRFMCGFAIRDVNKLNTATAPQEGDYRFVLDVSDEGFFRNVRGEGNEPKEKGEPKKTDANETEFLRAVAYWREPTIPGGPVPDASNVTDAQMQDFIKDQFELFGNIDLTKVTRLPSAKNGHFEFEIETKGSKGVRGWLHEPKLFFGAVRLKFLRGSLGSLVFLVQDQIVNGLGAWVALLVGVVITAFFIPNMMRKGSIDLLLSKPLHRWVLLLYKYVGGLTFVFLNTAFAVGGIWLVMGLRSGIWSTGFLLTIFGITFYFAILYAVSTFLAVLTRNAIVAILVTVAFWFTMYLVGQIYTAVDLMKKEQALKKEIPEWVFTSTEIAHAVLPRTSDLNKLTTKLVVTDTLGKAEIRASKLDKITFPSWGEVLGVSGAYISILLALSCWRFGTRDY